MTLARRLQSQLVYWIVFIGTSPCFSQDAASPSDVPARIENTAQKAPATGVLSPSGDAAIDRETSADPETSAPGSAQLPKYLLGSDRTSIKLQHVLIEAMNSLDATKLPNIDRSKNELQAALTRLENFIGPGTSNGRVWSQFLQLEQLKSELSQENPNVSKLVDIQAKMRQNYLGLEFQQYVNVRSATSELIAALRYGSDPQRSIDVLKVKLQQLFESLNEPAEGAGTERSNSVALIANYLHEMHQAPAVLAQIRSQFSLPNVQIVAGENLVNRLLARNVAEPNAVNECLLGTRLIGQACLQGNVSADVLPMTGGISLSLNLTGNMTTQSQGFNRGVVIGSSAQSPVFAAKQIFITSNGITSAPTTVSTNLRTAINSIDHRFRIVRRIAQKKAAEQKPLADSIAQGRLQNRISTQYDAQVNSQLSDANVRLASFKSQPIPELERLGLPRPSFSVYSTTATLHGEVIQAASHQLSANKPCRIPQTAGCDVYLETHQSALVNALDLLIGDRTIRNVDLDDYANQIAGEVPEKIKQEADGEEWSVTLATFRPVDVEFDDGKITVKLRTTQMSRGDQVLEDYAIATAVYRPSFADNRVSLAREGEVNLEFPRTSRFMRVLTLRSFLKAKFNEFFKEAIVTEPVNLQKILPKAPAMTIGSLKIDDGWVQIGVR